MLGWAIGSVTAALLLGGLLRWPRLDTAGFVLLPAVAVALGHDFWNARTSLSAYGWLVYPTAWALHFVVLLTIERRLPVLATDAVAPRDGASRRQWLPIAHTVGALLLLGQIAWEAGEWTARITGRDTVWAACAHLAPLALYLLAVSRARPSAAWPLRTFANAYVASTGTIVAVALAVGFLALAVLNPGDPSPLPYVPVLNPLDLTLAFALGAMFAWAKAQSQLAPLMLYRALGVGVFIAVNGVVIRTVHHWTGMPWRVHDIIASKPLQAALTLTWTVAALSLMIAATQRRLRALWLIGAGLLAVVVVKLFVVDLAALSGLTRVIAFLGVGVLLLLVGYVAPLPPAGNADEVKTG